ncbi:unnamed protein product [Staurois parvus]|uniref:Uncharacterized protein n=1 Tax=Staurois parvus TaxID=386267 RepID=A0ABN9B1U3_9NEOB|nr:unnamed protein product [Staurois parvus]
MSLFVIFEFPTVPSPVRPDAHRGRNPDDRCRHPPDYIVGDTAGGTSWGAQDKVSDTGIVVQRRMVCPSVARGYRLCYTREYRQGG